MGVIPWPLGEIWRPQALGVIWKFLRMICWPLGLEATWSDESRILEVVDCFCIGRWDDYLKNNYSASGSGSCGSGSCESG